MVLALLGVPLLGAVAVALVSPRLVFTSYHQPVVVAATVGLVCMAVLWRPASVVRRCCRSRWASLLMTGVAAAVALISSSSLRLHYSWDVGVTLGIASRLEKGLKLTEYQQGYIARYPNNNAMIAIDRAAYAVNQVTGVDVATILLTVAALGVCFTVWAVHRMVLPVGGPVRAAAAQLATILLVAASPWAAIPYTDVLALPFVSGGLLLAVTAMRRRQDRWALLLAAAAGSSIAVAAVIKTIPYVVLVAMILTGSLAALAARADRRAAVRWMAGTSAAVLAASVVAVGVTTASASALSDVPRRPSVSPPPMWWVANGMTKKGTAAGSYGGYNAALLKAISGMTKDEATQWSGDYVRRQLADRGVSGTARFYAAKAAWNWGTACSGRGERAATASRSSCPWGRARCAWSVTSSDPTASGTACAVTSPRPRGWRCWSWRASGRS